MEKRKTNFFFFASQNNFLSSFNDFRISKYSIIFHSLIDYQTIGY